MARWKPDASQRLTSAAIDLFAEQGFAATTVPQITERAGLTTRTYYRHFADKRDVLFGHENRTEQARSVLAHAPPELTTSQFIAWALDLMARQRFDGNRDEWRLIQALIDSDEGLLERALRKRATLCSILAEALQNRGNDEQRSRVLAEATVSAFYIAYEQWLTSDHPLALDTLALDALAGLRLDLDGLPPGRHKSKP